MTKLATYSSALAATFDDKCAAQPNATLLSYPLSLFQNDLPNLFEMFYEGMFAAMRKCLQLYRNWRDFMVLLVAFGVHLSV